MEKRNTIDASEFEAGAAWSEQDLGRTMVIGGNSAIATYLKAELRSLATSLQFTTRRSGPLDAESTRLDLTDEPSKWTLPSRVDTVFLLAGEGRLAVCEQEPERTRMINVDRTVTLIDRLAERGAYIQYVSTSLVFDGDAPQRRFNERRAPRTEYGRQKVAVEDHVLSLGKRGLVVRTTKCVDQSTPVLRGWIDRLERGLTITPFHNMPVAPLTHEFLVRVMTSAALRRASGVLQVSALRDMMYDEVARWLADRLGFDKSLVQPVPAAADGIPSASLPHYSSMDCTRLILEFGIKPPNPFEMLAHIFPKRAGLHGN
jgi:dTDP-4-dehydrorhamnose reductase